MISSKYYPDYAFMNKKLNSKILENPELIWFAKGITNSICAYDSSNVCQIKNDQLKRILKDKDIIGISLHDNRIWLQRDKDNLSDITSNSVWINPENNEIVNINSSLPIASCKFINNYCVGRNEEDGEPYLFIKRMDQEDTDILELEGFFVLETDNDYIYGRENLEHLVCLDYQLQEKWRVKQELRCYSDEKNEPQIYQELVILNIGVDNKTRKNFKIAAYKKIDGSLVWKQILDIEPHSSTLVGDKVYIAMGTQMIVLDANTGEIILNEPHGFHNNTHHSVYPFKNYLCAFSKPDSSIRVFTPDGKSLIQDVELPSPYAPLAKCQPLEHEGKLYQVLGPNNISLAGACGGLLIMSESDDGQEPVVEVEERPYHSVMTAENDKGEHEIVITMSHDDLEDVLRFGEIILKQTAYLKGQQMYPAETRDKKHNGLISFYVDPSRLPKDAGEKIEQMGQEVEEWLKTHDILSGDGKRNITIKTVME